MICTVPPYVATKRQCPIVFIELAADGMMIGVIITVCVLLLRISFAVLAKSAQKKAFQRYHKRRFYCLKNKQNKNGPFHSGSFALK